MRHFITRLGLVAVLAALVVAGVAPVAAQDTAMTSVVCDSDLILSLYVAEYYFDYGKVVDEMMMADNAGDMMLPDLASFDKGQYAALFDSMMGMMDDTMGMTNSMMSEDQMKSLTDAMAMSMDDMTAMMGDAAMMEGMTTLVPAVVTGEAAECTALRAELNHFYTALAYSSAMMTESSGG